VKKTPLLIYRNDVGLPDPAQANDGLIALLAAKA
jgi:hypothetical protein